MISTSGIGAIEHDQNNSPTSKSKMVAIARLLASVTSADKKIHKIENFTAEVFMDNYSNSQDEEIMSVYNDTLITYNKDQLKSLFKIIRDEFSDNEKISILRSLSALAICDGEVHPEEQMIIKSFMEEMDIDQFIEN